MLALCQRAGLVKLNHVALDDTKVKANASKHKAMSYRRMKEREAQSGGRNNPGVPDDKAQRNVVREMLPRERFGPDELLRWLEGTQLRNEQASRSHERRRRASQRIPP